MMTQHLTVFNLAERWNMNPKTLERWRWQGIGPKFLKLGGRVIYRLIDIEAYEEAHLQQSTDKDEGVVLDPSVCAEFAGSTASHDAH